MVPELHAGLLHGWRVLIVEDDPFSLDVATIMLESYGAEVVTATDGNEGIKVAQSMKFNFILSDISMPGMDGWMMIEALKSDPRTTAIPVIALTAHAMKGYRERAIASGFHNFLTKPLTPETFINDLLILLVDIPELNAALNAA
ncbi:MAG: response regulator [Chloroflexota bacterium]|nr:response regulator [Chloroflexota bacterium]